MYFRYRTYKKCIPATICSFSGGAAVAAGVVSIIIGVGLYMLADKIADRKMKKIAAKEAQKAEAEAIAPVSNRCPHCGTVLDPDDVFCYNCGTKRN